MTEAEWAAITDPIELVAWLQTTMSDRKLRLWGIACCRYFYWQLLNDERLHHAIEMRERYEDNLASDEELRKALHAADDACQEARGALATSTGTRLLDHHRYGEALQIAAAAESARNASADWPDYCQPLWEGDQIRVCHLLREVVGPFRFVQPDSSWQTATTIAIAQSIYDAQDYTAMPVLADALEEAGCDHADILSHLRGPGPHVRGCWVVDLLLGKE